MFTILYSTPPLISNIGTNPLITENFKISSLYAFLATAIGWGLIIGAVLVFGCLVISGFQLATGGNDSSKTKDAKDHITNCLFGFGVLSSTYAIALVVQAFLGINIFQSTPYTPPGSVPCAGACTKDSDCISPNLCIGGICQLELSRNCSDICINDYPSGTFLTGSCIDNNLTAINLCQSAGVIHLIPDFLTCSTDGSTLCCCTNNPSTLLPPEPTATPTPIPPTPTPITEIPPYSLPSNRPCTQNNQCKSNYCNPSTNLCDYPYQPGQEPTINLRIVGVSPTSPNNYTLPIGSSATLEYSTYFAIKCYLSIDPAPLIEIIPNGLFTTNFQVSSNQLIELYCYSPSASIDMGELQLYINY